MSASLAKRFHDSWAALRPTYSLETPQTDVYVGDCRQVLRTFEEGSVDLVFANPPFNLGVDYGRRWHDDLSPDDYLRFTHEWIHECLRVLAPHGSLWINASDQFAAALAHLQAGRICEAEKIGLRLAASDPRDSETLHLLGLIAHRAGNNELSIDFMLKAIAANPAGDACNQHGNDADQEDSVERSGTAD